MLTHLYCYASSLCVHERSKQQDLDGQAILKTRRIRRYTTSAVEKWAQSAIDSGVQKREEALFSREGR